jgi:hypothetical protein
LYHAVNTLQVSYKKPIINAAWTNTDCSKFYTKYMNILCGQNLEFSVVKPGVA